MIHHGGRQTNTEELKARIESLSPMGVQFVARLIDSLRKITVKQMKLSACTVHAEWYLEDRTS